MIRVIQKKKEKTEVWRRYVVEVPWHNIKNAVLTTLISLPFHPT